jgi:hypothetical protein
MTASRFPLAILSIMAVVGAFVPSPFQSRQRGSITRSLFEERSTGTGDDRRLMEFTNLEPLDEPETRRKRREEDERRRSKYVSFGDDLWDLRQKMDKLSLKLLDAINEGEGEVEHRAREKLRKIEAKDAELVYMLELADCDAATEDGRKEDAAMHQERAMEARSMLPQFNLEGLWVGKYGLHGYELINVTVSQPDVVDRLRTAVRGGTIKVYTNCNGLTSWLLCVQYVGDILVASKLTGDQNVPRGEITFQVDLSPLRYHTVPNEAKNAALQPIALTEQAARKWGTRKLPRYSGLGQVAEDGFTNNQWMDGQLIIIGDNYFSFAWVPIEQQIFFGRPSAELSLKMLREAGVADIRALAKSFDQPPSMQDSVDLQKDFVTRCLQRTDEHEDEYGSSTGSVYDDPNADECYFQ